MGTFADLQVQEILRGRRAIRIYAYPGAGGGDDAPTIGVRVITEGQFDEARAEAEGYVKKLGSADVELFDREVLRRVILKACVNPATIDEMRPAPFYASIDEVRMLDTRTCEQLAALYQEHAETMAPLKSLDAEQAKGFIEALKKEPMPEVFFSGYEHATLVRLLISLARATRTT